MPLTSVGTALTFWDEMQLEDPILNLVSRCQTVCVAECCGIDAFDFSPVHIASYLLMWTGKVDQAVLTKLRGQLAALKEKYGTDGSIAKGVVLEAMNQCFTAPELDRLVDEITANLDIAVRICDDAEKARYRTPKPETAG